MKTAACLLALFAFAGCGCSNLEAVRDFAATGAAIAEDEPVLSGWPHTYDKVAALAGTAAIRAQRPDARQAFVNENGLVTADAKLATEAAKLLGVYLKALGQLAGGSLADVGAQSSSIQASVEKLGAANPDVSIASKALSVILSGWQRAAVSDVVVKADPSVQVIAAYAAATADAVRLAELRAKAATEEYWTVIGIHSGSADVQAFAARAIGEDDDSYDVLMAKAAVARAAFLKIGGDHAALARNAGNLSAAGSTLLADLPELSQALDALAK